MASQPPRKKTIGGSASEYPSDYVYKPWPWDSIDAKLQGKQLSKRTKPHNAKQQN